MTLSLDDVRNKRFRMARKSGYEVLEVDEFVDEVEEAFAQMTEQNASLRKQIDALKTGTSADGTALDGTAPDNTAGPDTDGGPGAQTMPAAAPSPAPESTPEPTERIVVTSSQEASAAVVRLVQLSTEQSEQLMAEADQEAERIRAEAARNAERVQADAVARAEGLDRELETRRSDMFGELDRQRVSLSETVTSLRDFEQRYRANLAEYLRERLDSLDQVSLEPAGGPGQPAASAITSATTESPAAGADGATAHDDSASSPTPRLDALLGDQG